jgi:hypothetical protein
MKKNLFILAIFSFLLVQNVLAQINLKGTWIFTEAYVYSKDDTKDKDAAIRAKYEKETASIKLKMKNGVYKITDKEAKFDKDASLSGTYVINELIFTLNGKPYNLGQFGGSAGKFFDILVPTPTKEDDQKVVRMEFKKQQTEISAKLNGSWKFDRVVNYNYPTIDEKMAESMTNVFSNVTADFTNDTFKMNLPDAVSGKYKYDFKTTIFMLTPTQSNTYGKMLKDYTYKLVNNDEFFTLLFMTKGSEKPSYQLVFNKVK